MSRPDAKTADAAADASAAPAAPARRGRPRKTARQRDESERRAELVREAARLFRLKGYDATTTRDIAAALGMHSGSPFYYFESKNALLFAVMREGMEHALETQAQALQALDAQADALEQLRVLVRHHFEVLLGPKRDFIPVMLYEWRALTPEGRAEVAKVKDVYEAAWMPVLDSLHHAGRLKASPEVARLFIFGALNWSGQWFKADGRLSLDELTDQALLLFVQGDS